MFGNQRPAAPWSFNNFWGQYDVYGDLPNVAGSSFQIPQDIQAGDIAWVRDVGALYVCTDPTQGAAAWSPLLAGLPSTDPVEIYVAPSAATASDAGPGTIAEPLATLDEAIRRTNFYARLEAPLTIHLASDAYTWSTRLTDIQLAAPMTIVCDGAGQVGDSGVNVLQDAPAEAASSTTSIDVTVLAPAVDAFTDKSVVFLTGAAAGQIRTVRNNTAAAIVPNYPFDDVPAPGDIFVIFESGAIINVPEPANPSVIGGASPLISNVGTPADMDGVTGSFRNLRNLSSLLLCNLIFNMTGSDTTPIVPMGIAGSSVAMAGVEFRSALAVSLVEVLADSTSFVIAGVDQPLSTFSEFQLPFRAGELAGTVLSLPGYSNCDSVTKWTGWGVSVVQDTASILFRPTRFAGFLNYSLDFLGSGVATDAVIWTLFGGQWRATATVISNGAIGYIANQSQIVIKSLGGTATAWRAVGAGNNNASGGLVVIGGSKVSLENAEITLTGSGIGIAASGDQLANAWLQGGLISIIAGVTITAPRAAIVVCYGGKVYWDTAPTIGGAPTLGEAVITQSALSGAAVAPSPTAVAGVTDGAVVVNPDGSGTLFGRIT